MPGDLVMLKSEPRFKLDRNYKGPYRVIEVTDTNGIVKTLNAPDKDTIIVPLQQLSKCHQPFPQGTVPWTGHSKSRKRQVIRGRTHKELKSKANDEANEASKDITDMPTVMH